MDVHDLLDEIEIPGITESAVPKKAPGVERQLVFPRRKGANRLSALNVEPEDHDLLGAQNRPKRSVGQCRVPHFAPAISGPISGKFCAEAESRIRQHAGVFIGALIFPWSQVRQTE